LIIGGVLVAFGVLIFLEQAGYGLAGQVLSGWWPMVIIAFGAVHAAGSRGTTLGPFIIMLIGLALLAGTLNVVPGGMLALVWPVILVLLGLSILIRRSGAPATSEASDENHLALSAAFSGVTHASHAPRFASARLNSVCGGIVLDLRRATLDPDGATIDASATCGGIEIRVPMGWQVEMSGTPILGGYDSKALEDEIPEPGAPRLHVDVTAVCGGVSVKH
jgi:predicted membrane protein